MPRLMRAILLCFLLIVLVYGDVSLIRLVAGSTSPFFDINLAYNHLGVFSDEFSPGTRVGPLFWRDGVYPELLHTMLGGQLSLETTNEGFQTDHWLFNETSLQWACIVRGQIHGVFTPLDPDTIYQRQGIAMTVPAFRDMVYIYGGQYNHASYPLSPNFSVDDRWAYNSTSRKWKLWGDYGEFPYRLPANPDVCEEAASPGAFHHYATWTRARTNTVYMFGPSNGGSLVPEIWTFQPSADPNVSPFCFRRALTWTPSNQTLYRDDPNVGPYAVWDMNTVIDNTDDEIVWLFGGRLYPEHAADYWVSKSAVWRFNMTSNLWAFFGSGTTQPVPGTTGVSSVHNNPGLLMSGVMGTLPASVAPNTFYYYGGAYERRDQHIEYNCFWSCHVKDGAPSWALLAGDPLQTATVEPNLAGEVRGDFDPTNQGPGRAYGTPLMNPRNNPYLLQGHNGCASTTFVAEHSLLVPSWTVQPSDVRAGMPITPPPVITVAVYPVEFTLPVTGVLIELGLEGNPTMPDGTPITLSGNEAEIVNNVATFYALRVHGAGTVRLTMRILHRNYRPPSQTFTVACAVGCAAEYCTGPDLTAPTCRRCDEGAGYLLNSNYTLCVPSCTGGNYVDGPTNFKSCQPCGRGCAGCVAGANGGGLPTCTLCDEAGGYTKSSATGDCVAECEENEYNDRSVSPHRCAPCAAGCHGCETTADNCLTCDIDGGYARDESGACVNPCPGGQALSPTNRGICVAVTCARPNSLNATSCAELAAYGSTCRMQCRDGEIGVPADATCGQSGSNGEGAYASIPSCRPCNAGSYARSGELQCTSCENGYTLMAGESTIDACICNKDFFEHDPTRHGVCSSCPPGAVCDGGRVAPRSDTGFFQSGDAFISCAPMVACLGNNSCAEGYEDYLCGKCKHGFYRNGGICDTCGSSTAVRIFFGILLASVACLFLIFVAIPLEYGHNGYSFASVSIALAFVQVTATFLQIRLYWPDQVLAMLVLFSALNFNIDFISPECILTFNYYDKLMVELLVPLAVFGLFTVFFCGYNVVKWARSSDRAASFRTLTESAWAFAAAFLLFLSLAYIFLAQTSLSLFSCITQPDGKIVLAASPTQLCYDEEWNAAMPVAVVGVGMYIIFIPILIVCIYVYLSRTYGTLVARAHPLIHFAIIKYRSKYWFFELVVILRKLAIVTVSTFFVKDPHVAALVCCVILLFSLVVGFVAKPFVWDKHDFAEAAGALGSLLILLFGLIASFTEDESARDALGGLSIFVVVCVGTALFAVLVLESIVRYRAFQIERREWGVVFKWQGSGGRVAGASAVGGAYLVLAEEHRLAIFKSRSAQAVQTDPLKIANSRAKIVGLCVLQSRVIVVITDTGRIDAYNTELVRVASLDPPLTAGHVLCFTHDRKGCEFLVTSHANNTIVVYHCADLQAHMLSLVSVTTLESPVTCMDLTDENHLFFYSTAGYIQRSTVSLSSDPMATGIVCTLKHRTKVTSLAVTRNRLLLASGFMVQGLDLQSGEVEMNLPGHRGDVSHVSVYDDRIFTGTFSGVVRVWDGTTGAFMARGAQHGVAVRWLFFREGMVYTANSLGQVVAWQLQRSRVSEEDLDPVRAWLRRRKLRNRVFVGPPIVEMLGMDPGAQELYSMAQTYDMAGAVAGENPELEGDEEGEENDRDHSASSDSLLDGGHGYGTLAIPGMANRGEDSSAY